MKRLIARSCWVLLFASTCSHAAILNFEAFLDGLQEDPPNASPGTGYATVQLDDVANLVNIAGTFSGLIGTTTASHLHGPAGFGVSAGVLVPLTIDVGVTSGSFTTGGFVPIAVANVPDVKNGLTYINVHTTLIPGGEIRGQVQFVPEPGSLAILGLGGVWLGRKRRKRPT
jgi:hypothetical protein